MEHEELPSPSEPEAEHSKLLRRVEALVELSRKERERLELEAPAEENLKPEP